MAHNACISLLSSRTKCLPLCLESIHKYFNYRYNYPIYVHYFDDIYDDFKVDTPNVEFIQVPYRTPEHIPEEELFYNRKDNAYARRFGIERKGYLHMCNFIVNMYGYPNTKIHKHDYVMVFDDESGFVKELDFDPIDKLDGYMAAMITGQRLKDGKPPQNHIDTRVGLWHLCRQILSDFFVLLPLDLHDRGQKSMHYFEWSDGYVIKTEMLSSVPYRKWKEAIWKNGGIYKYRWGDNELYSLFHYIFKGTPIPNLRIVEDGYLKQDLFRHIQNIAPGVKDNAR